MKLHGNQPMRIENNFSDPHSALHLDPKLSADPISSDLIRGQPAGLGTMERCKDEIVGGSSSAPSVKGWHTLLINILHISLHAVLTSIMCNSISSKNILFLIH
jgi:hypothetical protein